MSRTRCAPALLALAPLFVAAAAAAQDAVAVTLAKAYVRARTAADHDADAQALALIGLARQHAGNPAATILVRAVGERIEDLRAPQAVADALAPLLARGDVHGLCAADAGRVRAAVLERANRHGEADALRAGTDHAQQMLVFGPFGDDGDNYLGVAFPPEFGLDARAALPGRYGQVTPRVASRAARAEYGTIRLRDPRTLRQGCYYALHQVASDTARACYVELYTPGSFEVFVNGEPTARHDGFAASSWFLHWLPVRLRAGHNHVLVKTALNGFDEIALRYVDGAGRPVPVRATAPDRIEPCAPARADDPELPGPFTTPLLALARAAQAGAGEAARALHLAASLLASEQRENSAALGHLLALDAMGPGATDDALAMAAALEAAEALPEEVRRSRARALLEPLFPELADHTWARLQRATYLADEDKVEDAIRLLLPTVAAGTADGATFARLHELYTRLEFAAEAARLRTAWRAVASGDSRPALAEAHERQRAGDHRGALAVLQGARSVAGDREVSRRAMFLAAELGDRAAALAAHAELHGAEPRGLQALLDLAELTERGDDRQGATSAWQALAAHPEASASLITRAGRALLALGEEAAGRAALTASLELDLAQHDVRRLLAHLDGAEPDASALARFRRDGNAIVAGYQPGAQDKDAPSTLLLDQMLVEIFADGSRVEETHQVRRINDLAGVERHQQANEAARASDVLHLHTRATDGLTYVPNRVDRSFAMPRLEPGAVVDGAWRNYQRAPGADPWRGPDFHFQSVDEPYVLSELVVVLPASHPGTFRVRNFTGEPEVIRLEDGRSAHVFVRKDQPRLTPEKFAPAVEEIVPVVAFGTDRSPGARARRARDHLAFRTRSSPLVTAKALELTASVDGHAAKAAAIHRFVHSEIPTSQGSSDPTSVLVRRQGARFWLEVALLREAGVPLRFAAVAPQADALDRSAPSLFTGDEQHTLDAVRIEPSDGPPVWIFADSPRYWPLGRIPSERLGAAALLLDVGTWQAVRIPGGDPAADEGIAVRGTLTLDAEGNASCSMVLTFRGVDGFGAADQLRDRDANVRQLAARQVAGQVFPGWRPQDVQLDLEPAGQPLLARGKLTKARATSAAGDASLLDLPLPKGNWFARFGDRAERSQPLALSMLTAASVEVAIDAGPALRIAELPADVHVEHPLLDYALTFARDGARIVVRREYLQRPGRLPAAQFGEWLGLLRTLDLAEDTKLRLLPR